MTTKQDIEDRLTEKAITIVAEAQRVHGPTWDGYVTDEELDFVFTWHPNIEAELADDGAGA